MKIKNAEIQSNKIILFKRKKTFEINVDNIKHIVYYKPTFWGFISAYISWSTPGYLEIYLVEKIEGKKAFLLKIKYDDIKKLPESIKRKIGPTLIP